MINEYTQKMKKLLFFSLLILSAGLYAQDSVRVSQLPSATDPDVDDIMYFIEDGISTNITRGTLFKATSDSVASLQDSIAKHTDTLQVHQDQIAALGTGDVGLSGSPADTYMAYWTSGTEITGNSEFIYDAGDNEFVMANGSNTTVNIGTDNANALFISRSGTLASKIGMRSYNNTVSFGNEFSMFRYGGTSGTPAAAPTGAEMYTENYFLYDGTALRSSGKHQFIVDGVVATDDFDTKFTWDLKDGAAASALAMTLDPAGLQVEDGFNVTTLANDEAETNLLAYDTGSGLVTYRSVASIPGAAGDSSWVSATADTIFIGGANDYITLNSNNLRIFTTDAFDILGSASDESQIGRPSKKLSFANNDMTFIDDEDNIGVEYDADYSANFTDRSLVDKEYVDIPAVISHSLTDGTPTDAQIDAATGTTPAGSGSGRFYYILDSDGSALMYIIISDGSNWQYTALTIAL